MTKIIAALLSSVAIGHLAGPAIAQDWASWGNVAIDNTTNAVGWNALRATTLSPAPGGTSVLSLALVPTDLPADAFAFEPTSDIRAEAFARIDLLSEESGVPVNRDAAVAVVAAEADRLGLSLADLADVTALYAVTLHAVVHPDAQEPTPAAARGVRTQMHRALAASSSEADRANAASIQRASDDVTANLAFLSAIRDYASQDAALSASLSESARVQGAQDFGIDLAAIALSSDGLVPDGPIQPR